MSNASSLGAQGPPPQGELCPDEPRTVGTFRFDDMTVQVRRTLARGVIYRLDRIEPGPQVEIATRDRWGFRLSAGVDADSRELEAALGSFLQGDQR